MQGLPRHPLSEPLHPQVKTLEAESQRKSREVERLQAAQQGRQEAEEQRRLAAEAQEEVGGPRGPAGAAVASAARAAGPGPPQPGPDRSATSWHSLGALSSTPGSDPITRGVAVSGAHHAQAAWAHLPWPG